MHVFVSDSQTAAWNYNRCLKRQPGWTPASSSFPRPLEGEVTPTAWALLLDKVKKKGFLFLLPACFSVYVANNVDAIMQDIWLYYILVRIYCLLFTIRYMFGAVVNIVPSQRDGS